MDWLTLNGKRTSSVAPKRRSGLLCLALVACVLGCLPLLIPSPIILVAMGLVPLALLLVLKFPFWVVLGFILFSFFRLHEVFPQLYSLRIPQLLALGSLFVLGWHWILTATVKPFWRPELTRFAWFFLCVTIGVFDATNRGEAMAYWSGTFCKIGVMVLMISWMTRTPSDFMLAARLILIAGILVGMVALQNKANGIGLVEGTRVTIGRDIGSMLGDPNDLSLVLMFPASFALSMLFCQGGGFLQRGLGLAGIIILFLALLATQSRGGLLGIVSVFGLFAWNRVRNKVLLMAGGGMALLVLFALAGISDRASGGAHEEGIDESAMGRLYAWEAAYRMALYNPLTGVGLDNFYVNYYFYSSHWDGLNHAVHSTWFGVMAETGMLGFALFVAMLVTTLRSANRSRIRLQALPTAPSALKMMAEAVLGGMVGVLVSGTFLTQGFTWPIYILLALTTALARYLDQNYPSGSR